MNGGVEYQFCKSANEPATLAGRDCLTPTGPLTGVSEQLLNVGFNDPIADVAIKFLPPLLEQECGAAFDRYFSLSA